MYLRKLGNNTHQLNTSSFTIWFSYETPIAFNHPNVGFIIRENSWGPTTGKHLNNIDSNKEERIASQEFEDIFSYLFGE